jgi:hypothetical protein
MWALRVLNGPMAGQVFPLKNGKTRLGRGPTCQIQIGHAGISKEHFEIQVFPDKVMVTDLRSSNGTFLNGVKIQNAIVRMGDKLSADKIIFDVVMAAASQPRSVPLTTSPMMYPANVSPMPGAMSPMAMTEQAPVAESAAPVVALNFEKVRHYIDNVVMPGLYRLPEVFDFKMVIMGFSVVFVMVVTLLSLLPLNQITSESIKTESRRRALTVARALANANEKSIRQGDLSSYSTDLVLREDGIDEVYILSKDGTVLSPPERAGSLVKGDVAGFFNGFRGQTREASGEIGSGRIAASVPIVVFDPDLQQNVPKAYAIVVYNTGSLKFDDGRALGLFVQMLAIALSVGGIMFFLLYKLIEYPFLRVSEELDVALREGRDHTEVTMKFPIVQTLLVSINSLLTRAVHGNGNSGLAPVYSQQEALNVMTLIGYPAMLLSRDGLIVGVNPAFESLTGVTGINVQGQALQFLPDQALQKNIEGLMANARSQTQMVQSDRLDISGHMFNLHCQALGIGGETHFFLVTITPDEAEGAA